nr:terminase small subunit [uncultured Lachnoanaerobaculum sp.]
MKLTLKQQRFADEYIISGNIYNSLIKAGYSENYAKSDGCKILENPSVKNYIDEKQKELDSSKLLNMQEALEITAGIARGIPMTICDKAQGDVKVYPTFADRQKALEHFYKIQGVFSEKRDVDIKASLPTVIAGEEELED